MNRIDVLTKIIDILDDNPTGVLATSDAEGNPHIRLMVPTVLNGSPGYLYSVTAEDTMKVSDIRSTNNAEWLIHKRNKSEILNLRGTTHILDHPSLQRDVVEKLGSHIKFFWKYNEDLFHFLVIETRLEQAVYYRPEDGSKEYIDLIQE